MAEKTTEEKTDERAQALTGVSGWLAFLVLSMALLSPARSLYGYYRDVVLTERHMGLAGNPVWETYSTIVLVLVAMGCLLFSWRHTGFTGSMSGVRCALPLWRYGWHV